MRLGYYGLRKDNKRSVIMENVAITIQRALNKTSWLLFMDGVQLPQGLSQFEETICFLPLSTQ